MLSKRCVVGVQPPKLIATAAGLGADGVEMLSSLLAAAPLEQQKHILGERLYPLVANRQVFLSLPSSPLPLSLDDDDANSSYI